VAESEGLGGGNFPAFALCRKETPGVVSAMESERISNASGSYAGNMLRPSDLTRTDKIAFNSQLNKGGLEFPRFIKDLLIYLPLNSGFRFSKNARTPSR